MSNKSRDMLKIVVGLYLIWLGFDLGKSALTNRPDNYLMFVLCGAAFIIVGGAIAIFSAKRRMNPDSYDDVEEEDESEAEEDEESLVIDEAVIEGTVIENSVVEDAVAEDVAVEDEKESTEQDEESIEKTVE